MVQTKKVIHSINLPGDTICVDVFERPDGSYGFDEFRRDAEDGRGWVSIGHFGEQRFVSEGAAIAAAIRQVGWFNAV